MKEIAKKLYLKNPSAAYIQRELDISYSKAKELVAAIENELDKASKTNEILAVNSEISVFFDDIYELFKDSAKISIYDNLDDVKAPKTAAIVCVMCDDELKMSEYLSFQDRLIEHTDEIYFHKYQAARLKIIVITKE